MRISDLMDPKDLGEMIHQGYVRTRSHPTSPGLMILNYTEKAQYEKVWNVVTTRCRGLIVTDVHDGDGEIVARPFDKFFNLGEIDNALDPTARVEVTDKADGSLGILYFTDETGWRIATRGSFDSDQAIHATSVLRRKYLSRWAPQKGVTYLFEIVYPENRIVLDYGDQDDLILLGARSVNSGLEWGPTFDRYWPGPRVQVFEHETLAEALEEPDRRNAEGLVVRFLDGITVKAGGSFRVKIKQEDYVRLHKLVTGLNERAVWEHMAANENHSAMGLIQTVPDEFHAWVREVANDLTHRAEDIYGRAWATFNGITENLDREHGGVAGEGWERGHFAAQAKFYSDLTPLLFQMLDGRDISASIWKTLRPRGDTKSLLDRNEDNS